MGKFPLKQVVLVGKVELSLPIAIFANKQAQKNCPLQVRKISSMTYIFHTGGCVRVQERCSIHPLTLQNFENSRTLKFIHFFSHVSERMFKNVTGVLCTKSHKYHTKPRRNYSERNCCKNVVPLLLFKIIAAWAGFKN
jgi:hypothetical protein